MKPGEFKQLSTWDFEKFVPSTDFNSSARRTVENDCLKIRCRVWIEGEVTHETSNGGVANRLLEEERAKKRKYNLANDFGKLFRDSVMTDITVTTSGTTFMAHKAVPAGMVYLLKTFSILIIKLSNPSFRVLSKNGLDVLRR